MPFTIDEEYLPATLSAPPMTDKEFAAFCAEHPDYFIEMTADGEIVIMPPNYTLSSARNQEIAVQLGNWARNDNRGVATDASGGFVLQNGARLCPDAAWTRKSRLERLTKDELNGFWHLSPDFVIELRSTHDRLPRLRRKMREWISNGAHLAWLIDPERRAVEVYRPDREPEMLVDTNAATGEGPVEGFVPDLAPVWEPLAR